MRAILLAAGLGRRLHPLTDVLPKCLAPIHERPLLEYWLQMLLSDGVERVVINTHYLAEMVEDYVQGTPWADRITLAHEDQLLGTGGTVLQHAQFVGGDPLLVAHADNLSLFDVSRLRDAHRERPDGCAMTMMTFPASDPRSCGVVRTDNRGVVQAFFEKVEKPPTSIANAAVYLFEPIVVDFLADLKKPTIDLSTEVIPAFVGKIYTFHNDVYHRDIGTLQSWLSAQDDYPGALPAVPVHDSWRTLLASKPRVSAKLDELLAR